VLCSGEPANFKDEIGDDGDVYEKEQGARKRWPVKELVNFERNESCGRDDGEEFGPAFAEKKPHALREEKSGIDEGSQAERAEFVRVHIGELFEKNIQVVIVRVNAKKVSPVLRFDDKVSVDKHVNGDADSE
jgi:hypothetical protein